MAQAGESPDSRARLGERLRQARDAKGVSAEAAAEATAVPLRYLRMFEEGKYPAVADPAYLTAFLRRYAAYLGLDAWQVSRDFIAETEPDTALRRVGKLPPEAIAQKSSPSAKERGAAMKDEDKMKGKVPPSAGAPPRHAAPEGSRWFDAGPLSLIGLVVTSAMAVGLFWSRQGAQTYVVPEASTQVASRAEVEAPAAPAEAPPPASVAAIEPKSAPPAAAAPAEAAPAPVEAASAPAENQIAENAPPPVAAEPEAPAPAAPPAQVAVAEPPRPPPAPKHEPVSAAPPAPAPRAATAADGPYELMLTARAREVWVWISADGGPRQEKKLAAGESASFKAEQGFVLTVDDAGGVSATLNGESLPALGAAQQARKNVSIPAS